MDSKSSNMMWVIALVIIAAIVGFLVIGGDDESDDDSSQTTTQSQQAEDSAPAEAQSNIVELAVATESLSTLVTAVTAGELVDTLADSSANFTVFAPTNDAFAALPEGTLDTLLDPANIADLQGILTYHVVAAEAFSTDLSDGQELTTVAGGTLTVDINDEGVFIVDANGGSAQVVLADVDASNGVVHVIDSVLLP